MEGTSTNYIDTATAARLLNRTPRWITQLIQRGELFAEQINGRIGGDGGISYRIPVEALPAEAQIRYHEEVGRAERAGNACEEAFDLEGYRARYGAEGIEKLLIRQTAVLRLRGLRRVVTEDLTGALNALASEYGMSGATLRRLEARYMAEGLKGLARHGRSDKDESRVMCLEARRLICEMDLDWRKKKANTILDVVLDRARELGPRGCEECPYNHESANYAALEACGEAKWYPECTEEKLGLIPPNNRHNVNYIIKHISDEERCYMREGRKDWGAKHMTKAIRKKPDLVNDVWFGDHHQFDVFVLDRRGRAVRPWLTAWYDIGSGVLVGWCISTNPNSETIAESFIRAVAEKPDSPIHGAPNAIYIDNGKDYRSHAFEGEPKVANPEGLQVGTGAPTASARIEDSRLGAEADYWQGRDPDMMDAMYLQMVGASTLQAMHVKVVHAKAYHGWAKPVERFFRTLEERYCRQLIGYCGGRPEDRAENFERMLRDWIARGELMTMDEFVDVFQNQILPAYNDHPHSGYNGETPASRYARLPKARCEVFSWALLSELRKKEERRKVGTTGIKLGGRLYWSAELMHRVGQEVAVKYTDAEIESITVRDLEGRYICEAYEREAMRYVGEDEEKVAQHVAMQKRQEAEVRQAIRARGVKLPGKRASGNLYTTAVDELSGGNITHLGAEQAARKRRQNAEPEWTEADEMYRQRGLEALRKQG